ncbi:MAG: hypothetical protein NC453_17055 [Muribaculum sp.]|nr:hypothetical protein [Muribaculum sp.]
MEITQINPILRYKLGQERRIVREDGRFDESIFYDQYVKALKLTNSFIGNIDDNTLKCIAFCGDRGEGKTSCMSTTLDILSYKSRESSEFHGLVESIGCRKIIESKLEVMDVIDPSFFDDKNNILEIVIGQLFNQFREIPEGNMNERRLVIESFNNVNNSISVLRNGEFESINELHKLTILAAGITLQKQIAELIKNYLNYVKAKTLIIPIDDIDLDIAHAYRMCEQIRKYLCVPGCIVFLSLKVSQLQDVVSNSLLKTLKSGIEKNESEFFNKNEISEMAKKYISKLLPVSSRVEMPKVYSLADTAIEIPSENGGSIRTDSLKQEIVELIYNRTRYLFYNPADGVSPIVPNNLRDLLNLIGLLASMEEIPDSRDTSKKHALETNKNAFKSFFFTVWKNRFDVETQHELDAIINFDYGTSFNKEVIAILKNHFRELLKKDYEIHDDDEISNESKNSYSEALLTGITDSGTFGYNVTAGDLFCLFSRLENETLSDEGFALVFFLKSLYSIKLYEAYDQVTEISDNIYPNEDKASEGLAIVDRRFDHVNKLQQLVGSSYFSYCPGEFIHPFSDRQCYDLRQLDGKELNTALLSLNDTWISLKPLLSKDDKNRTDEEKKQIQEFNLELNLVEFFILTTKCAITWKQLRDTADLVDALSRMRRNAEALHYRKFYPNTGYYIFDIMAPFANVINIEFAYKRFWRVDDDFYKFLTEYDGSLLFKILATCSKGRSYINHDDESVMRTKMHRLMSDATIRNAEVLSSVRNGIVSRRKLTHESAMKDLGDFYGKIQKSGMKTQRTAPGKSSDEIAFNFLEPLRLFLILMTKNDDVEGIDSGLLNNARKKFFAILRSYKEARNIDEVTKPTKKEIRKAIGRGRTAETIRKNIRTMPFFSELSPNDVKLMIPVKSDGEKYTDDEVETLSEQIYQKISKDTYNTTETTDATVDDSLTE